MAELRRAVVALPSDTAIFYTPLFRDAAGQTFITAQIGRWIGASANVPVYLLAEGSFGTGAVGGMVTSMEGVGKRAAEKVLQLLAGATPESMPFEVRADSVPMFDWRALQRWQINEDALPSGSVVRFKPPSLWREYGWYIAVALIVIVLQAITIVAFMFERRYRRRLSAERKRAELALQRQKEEMAHVARLALMGQIAASLAHELSQPLTAIAANVNAALTFLNQGNTKDVRETLEDLKQDQNRASSVIHNTRRFVRKDTAPFTTVNLADVVADVTALVRNDAVSQRVTVVRRIDAGMPPVRGDPVQLEQVLLNLLLNAFDAMSDSAADRTVTITAQCRDGTVRVGVSDRGTGLPHGEGERVFDAFYTTKPEGLGMGLPICRAIIHAHGGSMWAENNEHGGATFYFTLPLTKLHHAPGEVLSAQPA
jgi:signal transduction histidine kinase